MKNKGGPSKKLLGKTIKKLQLRNRSVSYLPSVWPDRLIVQSQTLPAYHPLFLQNFATSGAPKIFPDIKFKIVYKAARKETFHRQNSEVGYQKIA